MTSPDWIDQADVTWIRSLARSLCRDDGAAEDAAQETLLVWMERRPGRSVPRGWLRRVLENRLRQDRRSEQRRREREALGARPERTPDRPLERARLQREVIDAVLGLDEPYRETILLRFFDGQSPSKIAARQGIPVDTVKTRLKRGLARLRQRLDERHDGGRGAWVMAFQAHLWPTALGTGGWIATGASLMTTKTVFVTAALLVAAVLYVSAPESPAPSPREVADLVRTEDVQAPASPDPQGSTGAERSVDRSEVEVAAAEPTAAAEPEPELDVEVRVIDANGDAVGGVPVQCTTHAAGGGSETVSPFGVSDDAGRIVARMERVNAVFTVETERWTTMQSGTANSIGRRAVPTVMVARPRVVEGRVLDHAGDPVPNMRVSYSTTSNPWYRLSISLDHASTPTFDRMTDEDGAFAFERVPEMEASKLYARVGGAVIKTVSIADGGNVWQEIRLEDSDASARYLRGVVVDAAGSPIEGAQVSFGYLCSITGADGAFALDKRQPLVGKGLRAAAPGLLPTVLERGPDGAWPDPLIVTLEGAPLHIAGRVAREDGSPVVGATLRLLGETGFGMVEDPDDPSMFVSQSLESYVGGRAMGAVPMDANGTFHVGGLLPKDYHLLVSVAASLEARVVGPIRAGDGNVVVVLPEVSDRVTISGRVLDTAGEPIPGARITLLRAIPAPGGASEPVELTGGAATASDDGVFAFGPVVAEEGLRLRVYCGPGFAMQVVEVRPSEPEVEVVVEVPGLAPFFVECGETGARSFEMRDEAGTPQPLFQGEASGTFSMLQGFLVDGRSPVFSCAEGRYELVLLANDREVGRRSIELAPGDPKRVSF